MPAQLVDIGAYLFSFCLIGGYHLYLRSRLRSNRSYTIQSVNNSARAAWVENIMSDRSNGVLAVQTLRNSTMAATFLASTAILLIMGVLNLVQNNFSEDNVLHALKNGFSAGGDLEQVKLLILLVAFFWAFFSFSMAVRLYNHVGYIINATNIKQQFFPSPEYVSRLLNRSGRYYSLGMRAYFISVPLIFALFSPYYLAAASLGLIAVLYMIDRSPELQAGNSDLGRQGHGSDVKVNTVLTEKTAKQSIMDNPEPGLVSQTRQQVGAGNQAGREVNSFTT